MGLTQKELATIANVSQSLIAKIESNNIDPSYSNIQKLDAVFETLQQKKEKQQFLLCWLLMLEVIY